MPGGAGQPPQPRMIRSKRQSWASNPGTQEKHCKEIPGLLVSAAQVKKQFSQNSVWLSSFFVIKSPIWIQVFLFVARYLPVAFDQAVNVYTAWDLQLSKLKCRFNVFKNFLLLVPDLPKTWDAHSILCNRIELAANGCMVKQRAECLSHSVMHARKDLGIMPILPYKIGNCSWSHPGEVSNLTLSPISTHQVHTLKHPANLPAQEPGSYMLACQATYGFAWSLL